MRISKLLFVGAVALALFSASACLDGSTCLRNSDCAAQEVCSTGACVPAPPDDELSDASSSEGGDPTASESGVADVSVSSEAATGAADAGDAGDAGDAHADGDALVDAAHD